MRLKTLLSLILTLSFFGLPKSHKENKRPDNFSFVFIPKGSMNLDDKIYTLDAFWISPTEVTNKEYNEFLEDLKKQGRMEDYGIATVNNECWNSLELSLYEPYSKLYHTHPAFENYPVVGITNEGARLYCEWLSAKSDSKYTYRLPSRVEWIYAAMGGFDQSEYPWGGNQIRDKKGEVMCNYKEIGDENIKYIDSLKTYSIVKGSKIGMPVVTATYNPNEYGIYDVAGNVAEMVQEDGIAMGGSWDSPGYDVRVTSTMTWEDANPRIGFRPVREYVGKE